MNIDHLSNEQLQMGAEAIIQGAKKLRREGFLGSATSVEQVAMTLLAEARKREEEAA